METDKLSLARLVEAKPKAVLLCECSDWRAIFIFDDVCDDHIVLSKNCASLGIASPPSLDTQCKSSQLAKLVYCDTERLIYAFHTFSWSAGAFDTTYVTTVTPFANGTDQPIWINAGEFFD